MKSGTTSECTPSRGDIVLFPLPFSDQSGNKKRPVLVLTAMDKQGDFIAVPVTSKSGHENAVSLDSADLSTGKMPKPSWIKADKPYTLHQSQILKHFGTVHKQVVNQVLGQLAQRLGLEAKP